MMALGQSKMAVMEESQKYMMTMLDDLESDVSKMLTLSRSDLTPLYEDQDMQPNSHIKLSGSSNEARLFQKLDRMSTEMRKNDELIAECMKKMQIMDNIEQEEAIEVDVLAEGESDQTLRAQMHHNIKDTIVNLVNTLQIIEKEGKDLSV